MVKITQIFEEAIGGRIMMRSNTNHTQMCRNIDFARNSFLRDWQISIVILKCILALNVIAISKNNWRFAATQKYSKYKSQLSIKITTRNCQYIT